MGRKEVHDFVVIGVDNTQSKLHIADIGERRSGLRPGKENGFHMLCTIHTYLGWQSGRGQVRGFEDTIAANKSLPEAGS